MTNDGKQGEQQQQQHEQRGVVQQSNSCDSILTAGQEATLESAANKSAIEQRRLTEKPQRSASLSSSTNPPVLVSLGDENHQLLEDVDENDVLSQPPPQLPPVPPVQQLHEQSFQSIAASNNNNSHFTERTRLETLDSQAMDPLDMSALHSNDGNSNNNNNNYHCDPIKSYQKARPHASKLAMTTSQTPDDDDGDDNDDFDSRNKQQTKPHTATTIPPPTHMIADAVEKIHRGWCYVTEEIRTAMLRVLVATAMVAARWPRVTLVSMTLLSSILVVAGYCTNLTVRLDNEKLFTPADSPIVEYDTWLRDDRMYIGTDIDVLPAIKRYPDSRRQRRRRQQQWRLRHLLEVDDYDKSMPNETSAEFDGDDDDASDFVVTDTVPEGDQEFNANAEGEQVSNATAEVEEEVVELEDGRLDNTKRKYGGGTAFNILMHADMENIFTIEGMHRAFDIIDAVRSTPKYEERCLKDDSYIDVVGKNTCDIKFITKFWNHNRTYFEENIKTEDDLFRAAHAVFFPDGELVDLPFVLAEGKEDANGRPVYGECFFGWVFMKNERGAFEADLTEVLMETRNGWLSEPDNMYHLEFSGISAFESEAKSAIIGDIPLLPMVFIIMCAFTCMIFFKWHRVQSRTTLGIGAVVTILMSILSGYGLLFIFGVPITLMTNLIIFVIFGIGLDDTFIITGAYFRTGHSGDPVERVEKTMNAVGQSILLTTFTTAVAFGFGATSTILPIRWLCYYAFPTILIDFFYQITFFVALLVLDERRIQQNRRDCCVCITAAKNDDETSEAERTEEETPTSPMVTPTASKDSKESGSEFGERRHDSMEPDPIALAVATIHESRNSPHRAQDPYSEPLSEHVADRFMRWFATKLMNRYVKVFVVFVFSAFAGVCIWRTTLMKQEFNFKDLLPKDSYAGDFVSNVEYYSDRALMLSLNFRFVDQADPEIRRQMEQYIDDLVNEVDALNEKPPLFWAREFRTFVSTNETLKNLPFYEQLDIIMENDNIRNTYGRMLEMRDDGTISSSKTTMYVTDLNMDDVQEQIKFMRQIREVTDKQPANQKDGLNAFFAHDLLLHIFAFYEVAADQLAVTIILSVACVCAVAFVLIPHWSAVPIILPTISVLFIDMIGVLQMFGYRINIITYIVLVVSIGLLIDFIMHILLRYYESECETREEKVKDALGTMGASILVGGLSTFLGVTPLIFSSGEIFSTVCISFLSMVALGISHGLILLPVVLSYIGTETIVHRRRPLSVVEFTATMSNRIRQSFSGLAPEERV